MLKVDFGGADGNGHPHPLFPQKSPGNQGFPGA